jgi:hypothetical protein
MESWTNNEKIEYFLYCIKAEKICSEVRKVFNICRNSPFGRVIDPAVCAEHAINLVDCFEDARNVYPPCQSEFEVAKECIADATTSTLSFTSCVEEVDKYQNCFHPSLDKYKDYESFYREKQ